MLKIESVCEYSKKIQTLTFHAFTVSLDHMSETLYHFSTLYWSVLDPKLVSFLEVLKA